MILEEMAQNQCNSARITLGSSGTNGTTTTYLIEFGAIVTQPRFKPFVLVHVGVVVLVVVVIIRKKMPLSPKKNVDAPRPQTVVVWYQPLSVTLSNTPPR